MRVPGCLERARRTDPETIQGRPVWAGAVGQWRDRSLVPAQGSPGQGARGKLGSAGVTPRAGRAISASGVSAAGLGSRCPPANILFWKQPEEPPGEPNASIARWGNRTTPVLPVLSSRHARCTSLLTERQAERGIVPGAETGAAVGSNSGGSVSWRNVSALPLLRSGRVAEGARRAGAARAGHRAGGAARAGPREAREGRGPGSEPRGCQVRSRGWGRERAVWCGRKGHPEGKTSRRPGGLRTPGPGL